MAQDPSRGYSEVLTGSVFRLSSFGFRLSAFAGVDWGPGCGPVVETQESAASTGVSSQLVTCRGLERRGSLAGLRDAMAGGTVDAAPAADRGACRRGAAA